MVYLGDVLKNFKTLPHSDLSMLNVKSKDLRTIILKGATKY